MSEETIINKVAESGIITINLEDFFPGEELIVFDLKPFLFREMILKEKEFREQMKQQNWSQYQDKTVLIQNSSDAIIPMWAHMLVTTYLQPYAHMVDFGTAEAYRKKKLAENIAAIKAEEYEGKRIVIKGCGEKEMPESAYISITQKLRPFVKSLMFGEACSTVPIYKKPLSK